MDQITRLRVFLASPSDLREERYAIRTLVDRINHIVASDLGCVVELLGWEDTLPGAGRPQSLINQDVDQCDLFLGLLHRRWGQPTGDFASGFEEEFCRAEARRADTGSPDIWLFFKRVDAQFLVDPGEQLRRVLAFKREISGRHLYKEFSGPEEMALTVQAFLSKQLIALTRHADAHRFSSNQQSGQQPPSAPESNGGEESVAALEQIAATLAKVVDASPTVSRSPSKAELSPFQVARLHLVGSSLFSEQHSNELLSVHHVNTLFSSRGDLNATTAERWLIFRTVVADNLTLVPGWYWFRDLASQNLNELLVHLSLRDANLQVRQQALHLLSCYERNIPADASVWASIREAIKDEDAQLKKAAFECVASIADAGALEDLARDVGTELAESKEFIELRLSMLARSEPIAALRLALSAKHTDAESVVLALRRYRQDIPSDLLVQALHHPNSSIMELALTLLADKGQLTSDLTEPLLRGPSTTARAAAYRALIRAGVRFNPDDIRANLKSNSPFPILRETPDAVLVQQFTALAPEETHSLVSYYTQNGHLAYRALCLFQFEFMAESIRSDLDDEFVSLQDRSRAQLLASLQRGILDGAPKVSERASEQRLKAVEELVRENFDYGEEIDAFVRSRFTEVALCALSRFGKPADVRYARLHLNSKHYHVQVAAAFLLCAFPAPEDVESLLELALNGTYDVRLNAACAAVVLEAGLGPATLKLLQSDTADLVCVAVRALLDHSDPTVSEQVWRLLNHKSEAIREIGLAHFVLTSSTDDLAALLESYTSNSGYYYNVVTWIDRILYAPPPQGLVWRRELLGVFERLVVANRFPASI